MKIINFLKRRLRSNKFNFLIALELVIVAVLSLGSSYFFQKKLFLFDHTFNYYYIVVLIISLYYGLAGGFFLVLLFSLTGFVLYSQFPLYFFIHSLLVALVAGEFNFYFRVNIDELAAEVDYLQDKLKQIGNATLFTKLSHDNLEKNYLMKPYTLRGIVLDLSKRNNIDDFLKFLANQFHIESFALIDGDEIYKFNLDSVNLENELIVMMKEKEEIIYTHDNSDYLAVIPILSVNTYLVIKEMPFIHYNMENLMAIQFAADYFFLTKRDMEVIEEFKGSEYCKYFECSHLADIYKLIVLHKKSNTHSSIILFDVDKHHSEKFENFLHRSLRVLDFFDEIKFENNNLFVVVLPFTPKEGGLFFIERVLKTLEFIDRKTLYQIYEVDSFERIKTLIEDRYEL